MRLLHEPRRPRDRFSERHRGGGFRVAGLDAAELAWVAAEDCRR